MTRHWQALERDPRTLSSERLQLHYGALVLGSVAHSLLAHKEDDSHANLGVEDGGAFFATHPLRRDPLQRCALAIPELELRWMRGDEVAESLALAGTTLDDALAWAHATARELLGAGAAVAKREYPDFPDSPLSGGAAFERGDALARRELGRWFGNGLSLLEELSAEDERLSPIRVWPHHFDLGALLPLRGDDPDVTIGLGLAPGDGFYDEPYFYCSPYPQPEEGLPELRGPGHWHREGFVSAVLTGTELLEAGGDQDERARDYLQSALAVCREVLE